MNVGDQKLCSGFGRNKEEAAANAARITLEGIIDGAQGSRVEVIRKAFEDSCISCGGNSGGSSSSGASSGVSKTNSGKSGGNDKENIISDTQHPKLQSTEHDHEQIPYYGDDELSIGNIKQSCHTKSESVSVSVRVSHSSPVENVERVTRVLDESKENDKDREEIVELRAENEVIFM